MVLQCDQWQGKTGIAVPFIPFSQKGGTIS
jgi:hypothetical protein